MLANLDHLPTLAAIRTNNCSESLTPYHQFADTLEAMNHPVYKTRAQFIREQCAGYSGVTIFAKYREDWGIWNFEEDLVKVDDFKHGFLWCFRDHTTSWGDNQKAKSWFLNSPEALLVRRYEFWTWDNGYNECIEVREGSYKEILQSLLKDGDYEVLCSPVFSKEELQQFIDSYDPATGCFTIDEIIEDFIEDNPNYVI